MIEHWIAQTRLEPDYTRRGRSIGESAHIAEALDICGDAAHIARAVQEYRDAGVEVPVVMPLPWGEDRVATIEATIDAVTA